MCSIVQEGNLLQMRKYQLKKGYRDGSVAPQDFATKKVFIGSVIHEYAEPNEFIDSMVDGGYIEECTAPLPTKPVESVVATDDDIALFNKLLDRKKGKRKIDGELTA